MVTKEKNLLDSLVGLLEKVARYDISRPELAAEAKEILPRLHKVIAQRGKGPTKFNPASVWSRN